ncbi:family 92 glycoside hydrolase [Coniochaeta sp. 2T2.1]|nr:family 92 glycoside hydrolase [Coniochaeta sp. 2T2.1]
MAVLQAVSLLAIVGAAAATGSTNGGNTFPGVSWPMGMVKLGPDLYTGSDSYSGYQPTGNFTGFSMLHESGTGGAPKYGVVSQMPVVGSNISNPLADHSATRASPDEAEVGYYKSSLGSGVTVELAAADRSGMYRYNFPSGGAPGNVIVDVSHVLSSYRGQGLEQHYLGGRISVDKDGNNHTRYYGYGSYDNGWNRAPKWSVYFCGYFDREATFKTFLGDGNNAGTGLAQYSDASNVTSTARLGAVFSFGNETNVQSRVGVSFISTDQACENVNSQIPAGTTLETLRSQTRDVWNAQVFSKITTTDTDVTKLQLLYSSLYHMHLIPTNKTGENPMWEGSEPYYDDIFTLWDLFRCTTPLFHILQPEHYEEYIRSLIDVYRNTGYMPDARSSFSNGATQGGSNADNVLADAYVKAVRGRINWDDGYAAMVKDAEVPPPNNNDPRDRSGSTKEGRGALPDWLKYGFITPTFGRSVSRAVEYSVNDFALHQVAKGRGNSADAAKYLNRSHFWRNHWNPNSTSLGFSGFLVPRTNTSFLAQDPLTCGGCYWADYYYEALPWEYSFNAHHDINTLMALSGGPENFVQRLETFFNHSLFNPGNEPSFATPYLFHFANRQDLSVYHSRSVAKQSYRPTPDGLPGNSDAGAMESWILWVMLGLYPMTGQTTFLVGSPWFSDLNIDLGGRGKRLRITSSGGESDTAFYVQSLRVNGKRWDRNWVSWEDVFEKGGEMEFVLGEEPVRWDTGESPPSPGSEFEATAGVDEVLGVLPKP